MSHPPQPHIGRSSNTDLAYMGHDHLGKNENLADCLFTRHWANDNEYFFSLEMYFWYVFKDYSVKYWHFCRHSRLSTNLVIVCKLEMLFTIWSYLFSFFLKIVFKTLHKGIHKSTNLHTEGYHNTLAHIQSVRLALSGRSRMDHQGHWLDFLGNINGRESIKNNWYFMRDS